MGGQWVEGTAHDFEDESREGGCLEGTLKCAHLVQDAAKGPDVALLIVGFALAELRGDVAGRPHHCVGLTLGRKDFANPKVSDLDVILGLG